MIRFLRESPETPGVFIPKSDDGDFWEKPFFAFSGVVNVLSSPSHSPFRPRGIP
ncbi:MAG: hypothetical protein JWP91_4622 [Fibrobacteres bacterium]|nr:hypothetical protein [Fibrobacterota bacterium]